MEKIRKWLIDLDENFRDQMGTFRDVEGKLDKLEKFQSTANLNNMNNVFMTQKKYLRD